MIARLNEEGLNVFDPIVFEHLDDDTESKSDGGEYSSQLASPLHPSADQLSYVHALDSYESEYGHDIAPTGEDLLNTTQQSQQSSAPSVFSGDDHDNNNENYNNKNSQHERAHQILDTEETYNPLHRPETPSPMKSQSKQVPPLGDVEASNFANFPRINLNALPALPISSEQLESAQVVAHAGLEKAKEATRQGWVQTKIAGSYVISYHALCCIFYTFYSLFL